jgi:hypothetical protein
MEEQETSNGRRRGLIAAVLSAAAVAVALPVAGAFASGDSGTAAGDCPEKNGGGGSASDTSVQL